MTKHFNIYTLILFLLFAAFAITGCANLFDENETPITLTVTFKANFEGSTYEDDTQVVPVGKEFTLKKNTFSRPGYVFGGWSKDSTATTSSYQDGGNATFTESTILYAVWLAAQSTITFNGNGGTVSGDGSTTSYTQEMTTKVPTALTPNKFKRTGYLFAGWAEDKDASEPLYKDGVTYTPSGSVTLYAIWAVIQSEYEIHYMNGDTEVLANDTTFWADGYTVPVKYEVVTDSEDPNYGKVKTPVTLPVLVNIKETTKCFSGWYTVSNFAGTSWTEVSGVAAGNLIFYAKWADTGLYVSETGSDTTGDGSQLNPFASINKALTQIDDSPLDWTINIVGNVSGDTDIPTKSVQSLTIQGVSGNSSDKLSGTTSTIYVVGTTNVIFRDITITAGNGKGDTSDKRGGGIYINDSGAIVTLSSGAVVSGNNATYGGGVYLEKGNLIVNGGIIKGNSAGKKGGGVYVDSAGTFTLSSGGIGADGAANTAIEGGGVYVATSGRLNMSGGAISKNEANDYLTSEAHGGGIFNAGTVSITGGTVGGDITGVVSNVNCSNKSETNGGGIYNKGTLTITTASVKGNYAYNGGGVYSTVDWNDSSNCVSGNNATKNPDIAVVTNQP